MTLQNRLIAALDRGHSLEKLAMQAGIKLTSIVKIKQEEPIAQATCRKLEKLLTSLEEDVEAQPPKFIKDIVAEAPAPDSNKELLAAIARLTATFSAFVEGQERKRSPNPFNLRPSDRVIALIDGSNCYSAARSAGFDIDYKLLLEHIKKNCRMVDTRYYTALPSDTEYSAIRPLVDYLSYNGYTIVSKPTKEFENNGVIKVKGNMDIELAVDALVLAPNVDHYLVFSGDGDFRYLFDTLKKLGKRITVVSTMVGLRPMVADEIRRCASEFIEMANIKPFITRPV